MTSEEASIEALVRDSLDAWNANDWDRLLGNIDAHAVTKAPEEWPEPGESHGREEIRRQFERLKEPLSEEQAEVLAIEVVGHRAFTEIVWAGTGEGSGLEMRIPMWIIYTASGDRVTRAEFFIDEGKARKAWAGSEAPEGGSP